MLFRSGDGHGGRGQPDVRGMAEPGVHIEWAQAELGVAVHGDLGSDAQLAGHRLGGDAGEADSHRAGEDRARGRAPHRPALHGLLGVAPGPDDGVERPVPLDHLVGGGCCDPAAGRCAGDSILRGSAGAAWVTPRPIQDVGSARRGGAELGWLPDVESCDAPPSPGVSVAEYQSDSDSDARPATSRSVSPEPSVADSSDAEGAHL